jgi:hypothetical protein
MNIGAAVTRVLKSQINGWTPEFHHTIGAVPRALLDGRLTEAILDNYPLDYSYPETLSRAIAHQSGLVFDDEDETGTVPTVGGEAIGIAIEAMHALRTGDIGVHEAVEQHTWLLYRESVEEHGLTVEQIREYTTGMTWTEVAQLVQDAHAVPITDANRGVVVGTGGFVTRWLRPGDHTYAGPGLPDGRYGIGVVGDVRELTGTAEDLAEFGQALATRWQSPLVMALSGLADSIEAQFSIYNGGFAAALGCDVADAIATTLAVSGHFDLAARLIALHADADDEPGIDRHAHIQQLTIEEAAEAAEAYVRSMLPVSD